MVYAERSEPDHFAVAKAKSPFDCGKAESGPPNETSATVHGRVEPTITAVNDLAEDSLRSASTNVVTREPERPPRERTQRRRGRAREVINELFPDGIPDGVTDQELCAKVASEIEQRKEQKVSDTTIHACPVDAYTPQG